MNKLTYLDYCKYYAKKCSICHGGKRIQCDNVWTACSCQYTATVKWRFDQIQIYPANLKYKKWIDFNGIVTDGQDLKPHIAVKAKDRAMLYCFGSVEPEVTNDRVKNLIVHQHASDGQNVVIVGDAATGKSLLASLILKVVVYASVIHNLSISFKWIRSDELLEAARWDNNKSITHEVMDELEDVDFLVIDGIDVGYGHTTPPDVVAMNRLFYSRIKNNHPTVFVCSRRFWSHAQKIIDNPNHKDEFSIKHWGNDFLTVFTSSRNVLIELSRYHSD